MHASQKWPKNEVKKYQKLCPSFSWELKVRQFGFYQLCTISKYIFAVEKLQIILNMTCPIHSFQRTFPRTTKARVYINNKKCPDYFTSNAVTEKWVVHYTLPVIKQELGKQKRWSAVSLPSRHPCDFKIRSRSSKLV